MLKIKTQQRVNVDETSIEFVVDLYIKNNDYENANKLININIFDIRLVDNSFTNRSKNNDDTQTTHRDLILILKKLFFINNNKNKNNIILLEVEKIKKHVYD